MAESLGWLVNIWLGLMILGNIAGIIGSFAMGFMGGATMPGDVSFLMAGLSVAKIILIVFLFQLQKWAFYGLCVSYLAVVLVTVILVKASPLFAGTGLISPLILYLLLIPKWKLLR
jgi:hypothetical protein